jgi:hypothetical protein
MTSIALGLVLVVFNAFIARVAIECQGRISDMTFSSRDEHVMRWILVIAGAVVIVLGAAEVWLGTLRHALHLQSHSVSMNQYILWWGSQSGRTVLAWDFPVSYPNSRSRDGSSSESENPRPQIHNPDLQRCTDSLRADAARHRHQDSSDRSRLTPSLAAPSPVDQLTAHPRPCSFKA